MVEGKENLTAEMMEMIEGAKQWKAKANQCFRLVGEFMFHFAMLENELDGLLQRMMGLETISAAILTANIDMSKKVNLAITGIPFQYLAGIDTKKRVKDLKKLLKINDDRNLVAHSFFGPPTSGDGVQFNRTTARINLKMDPIIWSEAEFEAKFRMMREARELVAALTKEVTPVQSDQESAQWLEESLSIRPEK